jgi:2,4-dienoyl-CoA reductase-like NADH-dependent reductase (Old Yellow Enzyme family)
MKMPLFGLSARHWSKVILSLNPNASSKAPSIMQSHTLHRAWEPLQIGPVTLRNAFIKAATNENMSKRGVPTQAMLEHHRTLAEGGVGMSTMAYLAVEKTGRTLADQIWLHSEVLPDLKAVTDAVHQAGGKLAAQITHGGSFVTGTFVPAPLKSASGGLNAAGLLCGNVFRRAMNLHDMDEMVERFVEGAELCVKAGFDAVEIHMGHGYLLNQFISPLDNRRTDEFGGGPENRVRFPARVLRAVKDAVGDRIAVLAKINVDDGRTRGAHVEDAIVTAKALEEAGADMLVLSGGRNVESNWFTFGSSMNLEAMMQVIGKWTLTGIAVASTAKTAPKVTFKELYFWEYSTQIREAVSMPLAYIGGVKSTANVEQIMAGGFEAVVMGRALLREPDLINRWQTSPKEPSRCDSCNSCLAYIYHPAGTWCIHLPANEPEKNLIPASQVA